MWGREVMIDQHYLRAPRVAVIVAFTLLLLQGCAGNYQSAEWQSNRSATVSIPQSNDNLNFRHQQLMVQYREWQGTRYQLGGNSRNGIDCSGFVMLTFRDQMGIQLPRTTAYQVKEGRPVNRGALQIGDLVFFRTGFNVRHVGIYMGNKQFLHASTSKGVTISSLDNRYWRSKYWTARRIQ